MPLVTISMPVWRTPRELLQRAIEAVRAQTFPDWRLVLLGDGEPIGSLRPLFGDEVADDKRIVVAALPTNQGRYYADAVTFAATDSPWFAVHDSDDAAQPAWLERLLDLAYSDGADVALGAQTVYRFNGQTVYEPVAEFDRGRHTLTHHSHMAGLWRRPWLAEIGGPHPAFRVGFDTLLTSLPHLTGRLITTSEALYDRHKRVQSLTTGIKTGMRSEYRTAVRQALCGLYAGVLTAHAHARQTGMGERQLRYLINDVLSAYPDREAYAELREQVERDAKQLRDVIGE